MTVTEISCFIRQYTSLKDSICHHRVMRWHDYQRSGYPMKSAYTSFISTYISSIYQYWSYQNKPAFFSLPVLNLSSLA